ncbi:MAG: hypothetical protein KDK05_30690, partial [Candidatus Competibacteraceae bacterium]|nr:hypothetical protein [Candidatus Competibacteraceae bacterium]
MWTKEKPYEGTIVQGCLCCPSVLPVACLDTVVAVGFGIAQITKDGEVIFDEMEAQDTPWDEFPTLRKFEEMAKVDPDHDWRMNLFGPLR